MTVNDLARSIIFYDKVMPALGFKRLPDNDRNNIRWANAHISFAIRPAEASARRGWPPTKTKLPIEAVSHAT